MTNKNASVGRRLDRLTKIVTLPRKPDTLWGDARTFSLVQNDNETAQIRTAWESDDGFFGGVSCRRTEVSFEDGGWTISTHSPSGPKQKTKVLWFSIDASWLKSERIVEVTDGGEQIAHLTHLADGQPLAVKTVNGRSLTLTRQSRQLLETGALTIERVNGTYVLTTTSPVPLEAALLYWHLMLGDFQWPLR